MNTAQMAEYAIGRKCLDVGCGRDKIPGSTGIDIAVASAADVRHDLGVFPYPLESGAYDAIFCRNVMIYFDKPMQRALVERYAQLLKPGGLFFAGHAESLLDQGRHFRLRGQTVYELAR